MYKTRVWAHRGASGYAPENTMGAFALAVAQGADGVELDVHLSADGQVVVIHDETVDRTSEGSGRVAELTLEQLRALNFNRPKPDFSTVERIPTLAQVLELLTPTGLWLNIELKNDEEPYPGLEERCIQLVSASDMGERVWFSSFNHQSLERLKALDSGLRCGALYGKAMPRPWEYARKLGLDALHPYHGTLRRAGPQVTACHAAGLRIHAWTVNDPAVMRAMAQAGVDAIITDYPDRALREMGR